MKVLLVNPSRTGSDSYVNPPLHLIYIAQAVEKSGNKAEIVDAYYEISKRRIKTGSSKADLEKKKIDDILDMDFDVLGVGSIVSAFDFTKRLVNSIKRKRPNVPVIIGGGMSIALKDLWQEKTNVEYLVESDGEIVMRKFLEAYPDRDRLSKIPGLHTRSDGNFIRVPPELPKNLDYIDFPNWKCLNNLEDYMNIHKKWLNSTLPREMHLKSEDRVLPIVMTRGCPYQCTFCYHINNSHRSHSVKYIVNYLRLLKEEYKINYVATWDDLIMADRKWLTDLSDELIYQKIGIRIFTSGGKPNLVTKDVLQKMRRAGFVRLSYGIESGSQKILDVMKKQTTVAQNYDAVKMSVEEGLFTHLNMVLGMPGENLSTLNETLRFLYSLAKKGLIFSKNVSFSFATGYPGTELYQYALDHKIITDTEEYLKTQSGVGDYKYNLCGINTKLLKLVKHIAFSKVDFHYFMRMKKYKTAVTALLNGVVRIAFELIFPLCAKNAIRDIRNRKRIRA